jgi:uncharacterized protein (DUF1015 family)
MARLYPFRALHYNRSIVKLEEVLTQPYDMITPAMQQAYYQRSPYNLVRIILGLPELFDQENGSNVYGRAGATLAEWRQKGILIEEKEPAVFAYSQRFRVPQGTQTLERRGFIALGELRDYSDEVVFRHEKTLASPKSDRMSLLKATRVQCGQIFMLYSDPARTVEKILYADEVDPELEVKDEYGVQHRLTKVTDPSTINLLLSTMEDKKLIIADGHHRYETALEYSKEFTATARQVIERNPGTLPHPPFPEAAAMMTFVNMDAEGLLILPTHRVAFGLESFTMVDFLKKAEKFFHSSKIPGSETENILSKLKSAHKTTFIAAAREGNWLLEAKSDAIAAELSQLPERQHQLDVVQLHAIVLEKLLNITPEAIREQKNIRYLRDANEALEQVRTGDAQIAFLLNSVSMNQLREVAFAGEVMPPKSTDFYPKLLSGLTIYALEQ